MKVKLYGGWMDGLIYELDHYVFEIRIPIPPKLILIPPNEPEHFGWTKPLYATYTEFEKGKYKLTGAGY